jgi:hypothetical protein
VTKHYAQQLQTGSNYSNYSNYIFWTRSPAWQLGAWPLQRQHTPGAEAAARAHCALPASRGWRLLMRLPHALMALAHCGATPAGCTPSGQRPAACAPIACPPSKRPALSAARWHRVGLSAQQQDCIMSLPLTYAYYAHEGLERIIFPAGPVSRWHLQASLSCPATELDRRH